MPASGKFSELTCVILAVKQESVVDVKALKAILQNNHLLSPQSDLAALTKEYSSLLSILQMVQHERDSFCENSKLAQADLKCFEEEMSRKTKELEATEENLHSAKIKIVNAGKEVADLQLLLSEREKEQQVLEQRIKDLEGEALAEMSEAEKDKLKERIAELEEELKIVAEEKASLICKGDAMHATIQVIALLTFDIPATLDPLHCCYSIMFPMKLHFQHNGLTGVMIVLRT